MVKFIRHGLRVIFMVSAIMIFIIGCVNESDITDHTKKAENGARRGKLIGMVFWGPLSPVERNDMPSHREPASGVKIIIMTVTKQEIVSVFTDDDGKYSAILLPGCYLVDMPPLSTGWTKDLPATVTIVEGKETQLDIRIDTGIR